MPIRPDNSPLMIEVEAVTKIYRSGIPPRPTRALARMTLTFQAGEVVGIAGPNGAGKSTLLSLILGFLSPTKGSVRIDGLLPRRYVERVGVAYLPELIAIPPWWRVTGALARFAVLSGLARDERAPRVEQAIDSLGLGEHRGKQIKQLSKGNRQRVGIAQALLSDADIVVFDEPTHGLDPVWTEKFRRIVKSLRRPDRCIIIASHNLHELERVSDRVAILDKGSLTKIADLRTKATVSTRHYVLELTSDHPAVAEVFPHAVRVSDEGDRPRWDLEGDLDDINSGLRSLLERGAALRGFYAKRSRLESEFHDAVGE